MGIQNPNPSFANRVIYENLSVLPLLSTKRKKTINNNSTGWMSPIHAVTLPRKIKAKTGIPPEAVKYAYVYPQPTVAAEINWDDIVEEKDEDEGYLYDHNNQRVHIKGSLSAILFGGFAYFDRNDNLLCLNALSLIKSNFQMKFAGPFEINKRIFKQIQRLKRVHMLPLGVFHEIGFVNCTWVTPGETFVNNEITEERSNLHGAFIFSRENGTGVAYTFEKIQYIEPKAQYIYFLEAFSIASSYMNKEAMLKDENEKGAFDKSLDIIGDVYNRNIALHQAIKARTKMEELVAMIQQNGRMVKYEDHIGCLPLHYACYFNPDIEIVTFFIDQYPNAVEIPDIFGRYPLHIALDANAPEEVIEILMKRNRRNWILNKKTKHLKLLPIHIACMHGLSENVIKMLLVGDESKSCLLEKTAEGSLPLHLALLKKMPPAVIDLLSSDDAVKEHYYGMLPLQIACRNCSSTSTVKVLMKYDKFHNRNLEYRKVRSAFYMKQGTFIEGMTAVQLAVKNKSPIEVVHVLSEGTSFSADTVWHRDDYGRCALHYACQHGSSEELIKLLLYLDFTKETTQYIDNLGFMPIHYLCEGGESKHALLTLLEAEQKYIQFSKSTIRSTLHKDRKGRNPLELALIAGATPSDIEILIRPENFDVGQLDLTVGAKLAKHVCKDPKSQNHVIEQMANRVVFCRIMVEVLTNIIIVLRFFSFSLIFAGSQNNDEMVAEEHKCIAPVAVLCLCSFILVILEMFQLKSQDITYVTDFWNLNDWGLIVTLNWSIYFIINHCNGHSGGDDMNLSEIERRVFSATAVFAVVGLISALRYAFLPFARFIVGTLEVVTQLVPFLVVSALFLTLFGYIYFMMIDDVDESGEVRCDELLACIYYMFDGFLDANDTTSVFNIVFGVAMAVVLLNVLIAVVCEVWDEAVERANLKFWSYRIEVLSESSSMQKMMSSHPLSNYFSKFNIDSFSCPKFKDEVTWSEHPYNQVRNYDMYKHPYDYFVPNIAKKIHAANSLSADMYWINTETETKIAGHDSSEHPTLWNRREKAKATLLWVGNFYAYAFIIVLGIPTFGFLWPRDFRLYVLSVGTSRGAKPNSKRVSIESAQEKPLKTSSVADMSLMNKSRNAYDGALLTYKKAINLYEKSEEVDTKMSDIAQKDFYKMLTHYEDIFGKHHIHQLR